MNNNCTKSSIYNPMNNFMPFDDRNKQPACQENIDNTSGNLQFPKIEDLGNRPFPKIEDLGIHIYTMPVTTSVADSIGFANFLFPNPARCRETGYMCVATADCTKNLDRLAYYSKEPNYQTINNPSPAPTCKYEKVYR